MPYKDPEKRKEYARLRREAQAEKIAEYNKQYYEQNREAIRKQQESYREENREAIRQTNLEYYEAHKEELKESRKEYRREYYQKNRDRLLSMSKENARKNRKRLTAGLKRRRNELADWLWEMKCKMKCQCGENHPSCLDFHHRDPNEKEDIICRMVHKALKKEKILKEIAKCDVICSNCHRKIHSTRKFPAEI
jgi:hypothetical protein